MDVQCQPGASPVTKWAICDTGDANAPGRRAGRKRLSGNFSLPTIVYSVENVGARQGTVLAEPRAEPGPRAVAPLCSKSPPSASKDGPERSLSEDGSDPGVGGQAPVSPGLSCASGRAHGPSAKMTGSPGPWPGVFVCRPGAPSLRAVEPGSHGVPSGGGPHRSQRPRGPGGPPGGTRRSGGPARREPWSANGLRARGVPATLTPPCDRSASASPN